MTATIILVLSQSLQLSLILFFVFDVCFLDRSAICFAIVVFFRFPSVFSVQARCVILSLALRRAWPIPLQRLCRTSVIIVANQNNFKSFICGDVHGDESDRNNWVGMLKKLLSLVLLID